MTEEKLKNLQNLLDKIQKKKQILENLEHKGLSFYIERVGTFSRVGPYANFIQLVEKKFQDHLESEIKSLETEFSLL